ncbi:MAG: hypothetical protein QM638_22765 [Nocardioides sp.]|uniref:hypothetical protein n=1 Tax=Nocardioides sp. TaxID=35761 RepID=UPI0039E559C8
MRVRATSAADRADLAMLGDAEGSLRDGLVFVASRGFTDWQAVEDELSEAFGLVQEASGHDAPVVFVVETEAMLGRGEVLDAMVATGLVSGARVLAFEGLRRDRYVGIIASDRSERAGSLADAVGFATSTRAALGQVLVLGTGHAGGMFP